MTADVGKNVTKGEHLFIAGRVQTATATMEISVVVPQKDERSAAKSSSPTLGGVLRRLHPTTETTLAHPRSSLLYSQQ